MFISRLLRRLFFQSCIHELYDTIFKSKNVTNFQKDKKNIFLMMCPNYGNIGDQAICVATIKFLQDNFKEYNLCTLDLADTYKCFRFIKENIKPDDMIILQGGGNFGDLYLYIEKYRRFIVKKFHTSKIVSMPITCNFKDKRQLCKSKKVYNKHPNFLVFARDRKSYDYLSKNFEFKVEFLPDIVFYLNSFESELKLKFQRENILILLRNDLEKHQTTDREFLINKFFKNNNKVFISDTIVDRTISDSMREKEVVNLIKTLSSSKLVITDRMHGMILSSLCKTPCLVLHTKDGKLEETFELIKNYANVSFYDENLINVSSTNLYSLHMNNSDFDMFYNSFINAAYLVRKE